MVGMCHTEILLVLLTSLLTCVQGRSKAELSPRVWSRLNGKVGHQIWQLVAKNTAMTWYITMGSTHAPLKYCQSLHGCMHQSCVRNCSLIAIKNSQHLITISQETAFHPPRWSRCEERKIIMVHTGGISAASSDTLLRVLPPCGHCKDASGWLFVPARMHICAALRMGFFAAKIWSWSAESVRAEAGHKASGCVIPGW